MVEDAAPEPLAGYPVVISLPIQWGDQDAFGHVNNTIPIRWFESSRIAYLGQSGMGQLLDGEGLGPILASITCHYRKQLHFPDTVSVGGRISRIGRSSLVMEHAVYSHSAGAIAAEGDSVVVVFNYQTQRPTRVPDDVRTLLEQFEQKRFAP